MITDLCLVVIFICFAFMVLNKRIQLLWFAKGLMCMGMIAIIGVLAVPKHHDTIMDVLFVVLSILTAYGTMMIYKRGSYK